MQVIQLEESIMVKGLGLEYVIQLIGIHLAFLGDSNPKSVDGGATALAFGIGCRVAAACGGSDWLA